MNKKIYIALSFIILFVSCKNTEPKKNVDIQKLPVFDLYYHKLNTQEKVPCTIVIDNMNVYHGKIKQRGGSSIAFAKKSYSVKLKQKTSVYGMGESKNWMLIASVIDKSFMRNKISYDLFSSFSENNISPKTKYIDLYHNKLYYGIYLFTEKLGKKKLEIDTSNNGGFIFKDCPIFMEKKIIPQEKNNYYQQNYPKIINVDYKSYLDSLKNFIFYSTDKEFDTKVGEKFEIENIIDWHLMIMLTNNGDAVLKNFYLYRKNKNSKMKIAIWDYDSSYGRDADNELNMTRTSSEWERNILLKRLYNNKSYRKRLQNKWHYLRKKNIISVDNFNTRVEKNYNLLKPSLEKNFRKWPVNDSNIYFDNYTIEQEKEVLKEYISIRIKQLDEELKQLP